MTLPEFLLARIGEDDGLARAAAPGTWRFQPQEATVESQRVGDRDGRIATPCDPDTGAHIARWQPSRVSAECDAKRGMVVDFLEVERRLTQSDQHAALIQHQVLDRVLRHLALPFADHRDYQQEWRP